MTGAVSSLDERSLGQGRRGAGQWRQRGEAWPAGASEQSGYLGLPHAVGALAPAGEGRFLQQCG